MLGQCFRQHHKHQHKLRPSASESALQRFLLRGKCRPGDLDSADAWESLQSEDEVWSRQQAKELSAQDRELADAAGGEPLAVEQARRRLVEQVIAKLTRDASWPPASPLEWFLVRRVVFARIVVELLEEVVQPEQVPAPAKQGSDDDRQAMPRRCNSRAQAEQCRERLEPARKRLELWEIVLKAFHANHPDGESATARFMKLRAWARRD